MKTKEFVCDWDNMVCIGVISENIEKYIRRALQKGDAIYFYAMFPLYCVEDIDKLAWIKDLKHEEYDMIAIWWSSGRKEYYKSKLKSDMVIKLDLTDQEVKKVFDKKFVVGTIAAREMEEIEGIEDRKVGEGDPLFDEAPEYAIRNFVVTYNDEVIMDAIITHSFYLITSKEIVEEVDKECENFSSIKK